MRAYILQRLVIMVPLAVGVTIINFAFFNLAPGDPLDRIYFSDIETAQSETPGQRERLRKLYGLDKPMPVRYLIWLRELAQGNLGRSMVYTRPVMELILERLPATLELTVTALVLSTVVGVLFGVVSALRQYSFLDYFLTAGALFGISIPTFFFGLIMLWVFALVIPIFPAFGMSSELGEFSLLDNLHHLALPALVLSLDGTAGTSRYTRTAMLEVLSADYVRTAQAKGLSELVVIGRHAFRNALVPLLTITTLHLPGLFGGVFVIETVFSWPGMGRMSLDAIHARDYPVLMGLTFIGATLVLLANLIADILYAYVDPRIRQP
jgi:peptide/nickel transport system permease protein